MSTTRSLRVGDQQYTVSTSQERLDTTRYIYSSSGQYCAQDTDDRLEIRDLESDDIYLVDSDVGDDDVTFPFLFLDDSTNVLVMHFWSVEGEENHEQVELLNFVTGDRKVILEEFSDIGSSFALAGDFRAIAIGTGYVAWSNGRVEHIPGVVEVVGFSEDDTVWFKSKKEWIGMSDQGKLLRSADRPKGVVKHGVWRRDDLKLVIENEEKKHKEAIANVSTVWLDGVTNENSAAVFTGFETDILYFVPGRDQICIISDDQTVLIDYIRKDVDNE